MKSSAIKNNLDIPKDPFDDQNQPGISLILPCTLKMKKQPDLFNFMTELADKIEGELLIKHPKEKAIPVINKLRRLIKEMRCGSDGKSVGIFVSRFAKKFIISILPTWWSTHFRYW